MENQITIDCQTCPLNDGSGQCNPNNCIRMKKWSTHQLNIILRGICNGVALRDKQPELAKGSAAIVCTGILSLWDICAISSDAEAFGLKAEFHFDANNRIDFFPIPQKIEIHIVKQHSLGSCGTKYTYIRGYYSAKELAERRGKAIVTDNSVWEVETAELNKDI